MKLTEQNIKWYNEKQDKINIFKNFDQIWISIKPANPKLAGGPTIDIYQFITDPQYGFLDLFNEPDSPWQKGFWEWMEERKYGRKRQDEGYPPMFYLWHDDEEIYDPIPQMLTGYCIEYLEREGK